MKLRDEYWILTRDVETGRVAKMTKLPVEGAEFLDLSPRAILMMQETCPGRHHAFVPPSPEAK